MAHAPRKLIIVYGNDRPDIQLIYDEVADQARRNGLDVLVYRPGLKKFERQTVAPPWGPVVSSEPLNPRHWARALSAIRNPNRFFTSGRLRAWTLLDYLAFQQVIAREKPEFVFCLNARHSQGAVHACQDLDVRLLTHQHGDYYHAAGADRDVEGEAGTCLVWYPEAALYLSNFRKNKDICVSGSLKHVRLMRNPLPEEPINQIVFLDTINLDPSRDALRAREIAPFLHRLSVATKLPTRVKYHPLRSHQNFASRNEVRKAYENSSIEPFIGDAVPGSIGLTSESSAIYDWMALSLPVLFLKFPNSIVSIASDAPGYIRGDTSDAEAELINSVSEIVGNPAEWAGRQRRAIADRMLGRPETVDLAFRAIFFDGRAAE